MPSYEEVMLRLNQWTTAVDGEWCGTPMPLPGLGLVLEDRHPYAAKIAKAQAIIDRDAPPAARACSADAMGWRVVNSWRGIYKGIPGVIQILRHEDGRTTVGVDPDVTKRNKFWFGPFSTLDAWSLETELTALDRLASLMPNERMYKSYILTGGFLETSRRSGLSYWFRRLRPTVVLTPHGGSFKVDLEDAQERNEMKILCTLCLHPLAYYSGSFCGAMTPTDDVIAHLLLMRGDEALYWRRANQHEAETPEAGL